MPQRTLKSNDWILDLSETVECAKNEVCYHFTLSFYISLTFLQKKKRLPEQENLSKNALRFIRENLGRTNHCLLPDLLKLDSDKH